jgi:hypothetical protein
MNSMRVTGNRPEVTKQAHARTPLISLRLANITHTQITFVEANNLSPSFSKNNQCLNDNENLFYF